MRWAGGEEAWQASCQVHWDSTSKASLTFFKDSFTEIEFTYHERHPCKVYNSMILVTHSSLITKHKRCSPVIFKKY